MMKKFCIYLQSMIPPKRFDIFPPDLGMLRRSLGAFCFSLKIKKRQKERPSEGPFRFMEPVAPVVLQLVTSKPSSDVGT